MSASICEHLHLPPPQPTSLINISRYDGLCAPQKRYRVSFTDSLFHLLCSCFQSSLQIYLFTYLYSIQWHIKLKLASLTFKATHNEVPPYLSRLLTPYHPFRVLRSSFSSNLLQVPRTNLIFGSRSFRAAAPTVWNSLPDSIHSSNTLNSFRRHLKTH